CSTHTSNEKVQNRHGEPRIFSVVPGVSFPALMKLLGHTSPEMTMRCLDVALTDLQREFELARSKPRHLVPLPKVAGARLRTESKRASSRRPESGQRLAGKADHPPNGPPSDISAPS